MVKLRVWGFATTWSNEEFGALPRLGRTKSLELCPDLVERRVWGSAPTWSNKEFGALPRLGQTEILQPERHHPSKQNASRTPQRKQEHHPKSDASSFKQVHHHKQTRLNTSKRTTAVRAPPPISKRHPSPRTATQAGAPPHNLKPTCHHDSSNRDSSATT